MRANACSIKDWTFRDCPYNLVGLEEESIARSVAAMSSGCASRISTSQTNSGANI
jgi:hypothetical protein